MPTVLRLGGLRIAIYPNDHRRSHVHVLGRGCEAVFFLNCPDGPATLRESFGFPRRALRRAEAALNEAVSELCAAWEMIHGNE